MGFLGFGNFDKPGPGVNKDEKKGSRFTYFFRLYFRKFWTLMSINMLYILFCIPIVTIGPATAGMTYILRNYSQEKHAFIWMDFWEIFKRDFKQSFVYWLLSTSATVIISIAIYFYYQMAKENQLFYLLLAFSLGAMLVLVMMNFYMYLLIITVDLKMRNLLKNAFILSIVALKTNLITLFFVGIIAVATLLYFPLSFIVFLVLVPVTIHYIVCYNSYQYVLKYCVDPAVGENSTTHEQAHDASLVLDEQS